VVAIATATGVGMPEQRYERGIYHGRGIGRENARRGLMFLESEKKIDGATTVSYGAFSGGCT
jgi:hypothetical protein